jgi:uncharacterized iron-regulated protein
MNGRVPPLFLAALGIVAAGFAVLAGDRESHRANATSEPACLTPAAWTLLDGERPRLARASTVLAEMAKRDVLLLGEHHDSDDHHRWQVQVLAALHMQRADMVIGFEMFPRRVQPVLDRWVAGDITVRELLEQTEWDQVWAMPADLYLPLFQFARINRIRMIALNVDQKLSKAVAAKGWDAVPEAEREGVGLAAPPPPAYRDLLFDVYRGHASLGSEDGAKGQKTDVAFRNFVESQTTWDRAMAEALARHVVSGATADRPLVVGIMGSGHIRFGHGVPHQLRELGVPNIGTLLPVAAGSDCREIQAGLADAVFALPEVALAKREPPRLGVRLEESAGGVRIAEVTAGSLAEKAGLRSGDRLAEVGGLPVKSVTPVLASIRQQPSGTWLPVRVQRGDEEIELVVKFPAEP